VEELEEGVVVTDPQLRALCWNASALRILDLDPTRIAGSTAPFQHHLAHRRRARRRHARTDMTCALMAEAEPSEQSSGERRRQGAITVSRITGIPHPLIGWSGRVGAR
jgi:hypothetical protein